MVQQDLHAVGNTASEDKALHGTTSPARGNPLAHRRVDTSFTGSAGGKPINRVQDCHPALRGDFRERWYGEKHGLPALAPQTDVKSVGMINIANNLNHQSARPNTGGDKQGSADHKMVNNNQSCHPVLRTDQSYRQYIEGTMTSQGVVRGAASKATDLESHYWRGPHFGGGTAMFRGMQRAHASARKVRSTPDLARRRLGSSSALELYRPAAISNPVKSLTSPPFGSSRIRHTPPATADAARDEEAQPWRARRELCIVKANHQRSPPLPPSLSRLTPVPTLAWNGTTGQHPTMPSYRSQGLWYEEQDFAGPLKQHSSLSPGSGSVLTPGIGAPFDDRRGGRLLRPMVVTDDKWKTAGYNAELSRLSSPDKVMSRAGGGGAQEMRARTKGDRIWLSGNSWMSFS